jgi:hypothetical protein
MAGWVRLHRSITDHWVFQDAEFFRCWTLMIMDANHQTKKHMFNGALMTIERGQFIFGLEAYERKSGMTIARLRRLLSMLETEGMINRQKTNKFSLISITNYEDYQSDDRQKTSKTQADDKPIATPKECKELQEQHNGGQGAAEAVASVKSVSDCPHQDIINLYHEKCPTLRKVKVWSGEREKHLRARWRQAEKHQSLEFWARYFEYVAASDFLIGNAGSFSADLEWLVKPSNFIKVVEGKYDNRG